MPSIDDEKRNNSRRWFRYAALSSYPDRLQTAVACLRQADDLLSALHANARRNPRDSGHFDTKRFADVSRAIRRRIASKSLDRVRGTIEAGRDRPSISDRSRLLGRRGCFADSWR